MEQIPFGIDLLRNRSTLLQRRCYRVGILFKAKVNGNGEWCFSIFRCCIFLVLFQIFDYNSSSNHLYRGVCWKHTSVRSSRCHDFIALCFIIFVSFLMTAMAKVRRATTHTLTHNKVTACMYIFNIENEKYNDSKQKDTLTNNCVHNKERELAGEL